MDGTKGECRMDDKVEGNYRNPRFLMEPLEIVLCSHLNRSGFCEGEMGSGVIEGAVIKLAVGKVGMKSSELSIQPPILLSGKSVDEVGRTGGKGALCKI